MFRIDVATAAGVLPVPAAAGVPGYFSKGDPATATPATVVTDDWCNMMQEELMSILAASGIAPSKTTYNQVLAAIKLLIQNETGNYAVDTGAANAYVIAPNPPVPAYIDGLNLRFRPIHTNTAASTINVNGLGAVAILREDGSALHAGDIPSTGIVTINYVAAALNCFVLGAVAPLSATQEIQDQAGNYAADTGGVNTMVAAYTPVLLAHKIGRPLRVKVNNTNTGAATFNPGPGAVAVQNNGAALTGNELTAGRIVELWYDGAVYQLNNSQSVTGTGAYVLQTNASLLGTTSAATLQTSGNVTIGGATNIQNGSGLGIIISSGQMVSGGSTASLQLGGSGASTFTISSTSVAPKTDNAQSNGTSNFRWTIVWATTGTINTSDAREKQDFAALSDAEKRAGRTLAQKVLSFRRKDAVAEKKKKGLTARKHIGWTAQDVHDALAAEGLDPWGYAMLCKDPILHEVDVDVEVDNTFQAFHLVDGFGYQKVKLKNGAEVMKRVKVQTPELEWNEFPLVDENNNPVMVDCVAQIYREPKMVTEKATVTQKKWVPVDAENEYRLGLRYDQVLAFVMHAVAS